MSQSPLLANLPYSELEHGWALDVGCFLAARCTALGRLAHTDNGHTRSQLLEHVRLYSFNIQRRLVAYDSAVDDSIFDANRFHHMGSTMAAVAAKVQGAHSTLHCVFLLLGSATTFIELGMKSGLHQGCSESADLVIKQLLALGLGMFPARTPVEALRSELTILGGSVDRLRRVLFANSRRKSSESSYVFIADIRTAVVDGLTKQDLGQRLVPGVL